MLTPGNRGFTYSVTINDERSNGCGQHGQGEELTKYTILYRRDKLHQVAMAMMMDAFWVSNCPPGFRILVNMDRRQYKHWHKYGQ